MRGVANFSPFTMTNHLALNVFRLQTGNVVQQLLSRLLIWDAFEVRRSCNAKPVVVS